MPIDTSTAQEFADEVVLVLTAWGFPRQRRVVFDLHTQDLIIDGKHRKDNGKGVRAITHATSYRTPVLSSSTRR